VKGHSYVPGKDPVLDADLAELRKGLKKGEDPFFYDIRRPNGDGSGKSATPHSGKSAVSRKKEGA
jgi:hypothetical protein